MSMKDLRSGVCPICDHREVVCAEALEFAARDSSEPMAVAYGGKDGMLGFRPEPDKPSGALRTYTCRSCGYTQWYADAPDEIPIDPTMRTTLIRAE